MDAAPVRFAATTHLGRGAVAVTQAGNRDSRRRPHKDLHKQGAAPDCNPSLPILWEVFRRNRQSFQHQQAFSPFHRINPLHPLPARVSLNVRDV
jgi:hypothetical protein